jgi:C2 domain
VTKVYITINNHFNNTMTRLLCVFVVLLVAFSCHVAGVDVQRRASSAATMNMAYSLPNHRSLAETAFDAVKKENGGDAGPKENLYKSVQRHREQQRQKDSKKERSIFSKIKSFVSDKFEKVSTHAGVAFGKAFNFVVGKKDEAQSVLDKSHNFHEYVQRVNLRLGVTYPDVPLPGNKPISRSDSLRTIALRLFTVRHVGSGSVSGARAMAATHEGDRQYWHSMSSGTNKHETNGAVVSAITLYLKELYEDSRKAQPVEHRWWYYGRILHAIEDSYSDAHVNRANDEDLSVRFFENYADQDGHKHSISDDSPEHDLELINEARADNDLDDADIKLRLKLQKHKKLLWRRAEEMSIAFLRIVWDNVASSPGEAAPDKWKEIRKFLDENVYYFSSAWLMAGAGGSVPEYAKKGVKGRNRDSYVHGDFTPDEKLFMHDLNYVMQQPESNRVTVIITHITGHNLHDADLIGESDAFVVIKSGKLTPFQTQTVAPTAMRRQSKEFDVEWNLFREMSLPASTVMHIEVYDSDTLIGVPKPEDSDFMGKGEITFEDFLSPNSKHFAHERVTVTRKINLTRKGKPAGYLMITGDVSKFTAIPVPNGPDTRAVV